MSTWFKPNIRRIFEQNMFYFIDKYHQLYFEMRKIHWKSLRSHNPSINQFGWDSNRKKWICMNFEKIRFSMWILLKMSHILTTPALHILTFKHSFFFGHFPNGNFQFIQSSCFNSSHFKSKQCAGVIISIFQSYGNLHERKNKNDDSTETRKMWFVHKIVICTII